MHLFGSYEQGEPAARLLTDNGVNENEVFDAWYVLASAVRSRL